MLIIYYDFIYFVLTCLIIFFIVISSRSIYRKEFKDIKTINLHYDEIDTGDLLFVHYDFNYHIHGILSSFFSHVAICSREDSNLYVYDIQIILINIMVF